MVIHFVKVEGDRLRYLCNGTLKRTETNSTFKPSEVTCKNCLRSLFSAKKVAEGECLF
jgi:hypothetical protein